MKITYSHTFPSTLDPLPGDEGPLRVGQSRTATWRPDPPPRVNHRRFLITLALIDALLAGAVTAMLLYCIPYVAYDYLQTSVGTSVLLGILVAGVWSLIAWWIVKGIWPRE